MGGTINVHRKDETCIQTIRNPESKRSLGTDRWIITKTELQEIECEDKDEIQLAQGKVQ
jgi:hypothetical protein